MLIVASLSPDSDMIKKTKELHPEKGNFCRAAYEDDAEYLSGFYHFGKAVCIAEIYKVEPFSTAHEKQSLIEYDPGYFAWHLRNIRPVFPFHVKGQLSLYNVPDHLIKPKP